MNSSLSNYFSGSLLTECQNTIVLTLINWWLSEWINPWINDIMLSLTHWRMNYSTYIKAQSLNFVFLFTTDRHYFYAKNKIDNTFKGILPKRWRFLIKPLRLGIDVLFLKYTFVFRWNRKKGWKFPFNPKSCNYTRVSFIFHITNSFTRFIFLFFLTH